MSPNPDRPSYSVAKYLETWGYKVIPVNPKEKEIMEQKAYADLQTIPDRIDIVDVFRKPEAAIGIVKEAIAIGAKAVWLQETVISYEAFRAGEKAGLVMVMDRCMFKEHGRLMGQKRGAKDGFL